MSSTHTRLIYHLVFSTKHRSHCLEGPWVQDLYAYLGGIIREFGGKLEAIGGHSDHVHLCVRLLPRDSISDVLGTLKTQSSGWMNVKGHMRSTFKWQVGYSAFTVSHSQVAAVNAYIANQEEHHRTRTYDDELELLLQKHGMLE